MTKFQIDDLVIALADTYNAIPKGSLCIVIHSYDNDYRTIKVDVQPFPIDPTFLTKFPIGLHYFAYEVGILADTKLEKAIYNIGDTNE